MIALPIVAASAIAALLGVLYGLGMRRAQASNRPLPGRRGPRAAVFAGGVGCFWLSCVLPGGSVLPEMTGHVLLAFAAPPLLLLGVPRQALLPLFVHRRSRRLLKALTQPARAVVVFLGVLLLCYLPVVFDATLVNALYRFGIGLAIFTAALIFWWPVIEPFPTWDRELAGLGKLLYLFVGSSVLKALGFILALVPQPIYSLPVHVHPLWGLRPIDDQQYAGWLMVAAGALVLLAAATVICFQLLLEPDETDGSFSARGQGSKARGRGR